MKQTINEYQFRRAFEKCRPNNFSYEGLTALYDYLQQYEEDTETELELDVIGLCCEFSEYKDLKDFQSDYNGIFYKKIEDIEEVTSIIKIEGTEGFIIQQF